MRSNRKEIENHEKIGDIHVSAAYKRASCSSHSNRVIDRVASQKIYILDRSFFMPELLQRRGHPYRNPSFSNARHIIEIRGEHLRLAVPKLRRMLSRFQKLMDLRLYVLKIENKQDATQTTRIREEICMVSFG